MKINYVKVFLACIFLLSLSHTLTIFRVKLVEEIILNKQETKYQIMQ